MADTLLTADIIAKEALMILNNNLGPLDTFYRAHESEYSNSVNGYKIGSTISINRPADFTIRTGKVASNQDVIEGKVTLTVDQQKGVDFNFDSQQLSLDIGTLSERVIKPAMINIINDILRDCLDVFYKDTYNWVGDPGQVINSWSDFSKGPERLDELAAPQDSRTSVLSPNDYWTFAGAQTQLLNNSIVGDASRQGDLGMVAGITPMMSQVTPTHTVGAHGGTPLVDGAAQNVTYDTAKNTWTQTLITDGWTGSADLLQGDVFTIADVYMVNPKTKAKLDILQQFVLTADVTTNASDTADTNLVIAPPIITSGPHQTVNAAPADDAVITYAGTAGTAYRQNLAYHRNAYALAMVPLEMAPGSVDGSRQSMNGISVRVIPYYDGVNDVSNWRLDVLYGRRAIDPRICTRLSGSS